MVRWEDSLNRNPPDGLLSTVSEVYCEVLRKVDWCAEERPNWMTNDLQFSVQEDGYSCGFYVMCEIRMRGSCQSAMPVKDLKNYEPSVTEELRLFCVSRYLNAIITSYKLGNRNLDDAAVFR